MSIKQRLTKDIVADATARNAPFSDLGFQLYLAAHARGRPRSPGLGPRAPSGLPLRPERQLRWQNQPSAAGHTGSSSLGPRAMGRLLTSSRASGGPRGATRGPPERAQPLLWLKSYSTLWQAQRRRPWGPCARVALRLLGRQHACPPLHFPRQRGACAHSPASRLPPWLPRPKTADENIHNFFLYFRPKIPKALPDVEGNVVAHLARFPSFTLHPTP